METSPWIVPDELWDRVKPLLPQRERRFRHPGRKALPDRDVLCGILYVLHTGIQREYLPKDMGFGNDAVRHSAELIQHILLGLQPRPDTK